MRRETSEPFQSGSYLVPGSIITIQFIAHAHESNS
jgi:hypothetical protein